MSNNFDELYTKLNQEQKDAVSQIDGPVMVIAGPGTGKTQVLTMRVANILMKTDTRPDSILALTFTESGVRAMRERLLSIVGTTAYYINIHTFHSFASDIIRSNPDEFIISTQLEPLSDLERVHIFKEIFDELDLKSIKPFNAPYYYLRTAISKIQDLKREGISTDEYAEFINNANLEEKDQLKNDELIKIYESYQKKLIEYGRYDFEDMINFVINRFKESPDLLAKYQERFQYFLVDEFQDTNSAQAELLYQLSSFWGDNANLFVVGDDDQSIYRFQGASLQNIIDFNKRYPNAQKVILTKNYRSVQPILNVAESVIENNTLRITNELELSKNQDSQVKNTNEKILTYGEFSSSYIENHYIATEIKKKIEDGIKPSEIAVIYRNNADSTDIADMLSRFGIKYVLEGGENVLYTGIIVRLLHLLRVINKVKNKEEDLDLFTLLNYEFLHINALDVLKLSRFASDRKINLFEALNRSDLKEKDLDDYEKLISIFEKIVYWNEKAANTTFIEFLEEVMEESGYINWILQHESSYEYLNKLNSFLSEVKRLNQSNKNLNLDEFLNYIDLMIENGIAINEETIDLDINAVRLMTAHKSKGLEFEYVFIPKFIDTKWSNIKKRDLIKFPKTMIVQAESDRDEEIQQEEDERRLFYVALTRAKNELYLLSSKAYQSQTYNKEGIVSMFFHETPEENREKINVTEYEIGATQILKDLLKPKIKDDISSDNEKAFLQQVLRNFKLSASSLNTYLDCPYKFKLEYLFRTPTKPIRAFILGSAVHSALEEANKALQEGKNVDGDYLKLKFSDALKSEIINDQEYTEIESEGHLILDIYYDTYSDEYANPTDAILHIEKFLGWGFSRPILDGHIHLQGKIDRIDKIDINNETKKTEVRITDYKTGNTKSRNQILGKTKYSDLSQFRQLMFYKLLVELDESLRLNVNEVELDYIGKRGSKPKREVFTISDEDMNKFKDLVRTVSQNIAEMNFSRTSDYKSCHDCRFRYHCWPDGIPVSSEEQLTLGL